MSFRVLIVAILIAVPMSVFAQSGLIPCDGVECQACHLLQLVKNILDFIFELAIFVAVFTIMYAGWEFMTSGENAGKRTAAKKRITNIFIGIAIMLGSWLMVDSGLKLLFDNQRFGTWNKIQCVQLPTYTQRAPETSASSTTSTGAGPVVVGAGKYPDSCTTCTSLSSAGLACKSASSCTTVPELKDKLVDLNGDFSGMMITESYPRTVVHSNKCHYEGTCVDAAFRGTAYTVDTVGSFMDKAKSSGLRPVYEGNDCSIRDSLRSKGYSAYCKSDPGYGHITGDHFSLYNN